MLVSFKVRNKNNFQFIFKKDYAAINSAYMQVKMII